MKKLTLTLAALALVLGISQCKKQEEPAQNGQKQHVVLNASFGDSNSKIVDAGSGNLKWTQKAEGVDGDKIVVKQGDVELGTLECMNAESGIFEGDITSTTGYIIFTFGEENYLDQTGELNAAMHLTSGEVEYKDDGNYGIVPMSISNAVLKLDLSNYGGTGAGNMVTILADDVEVASVAGVTSESKEVYVAVPAEGTEKTYTIEGNSYGAVKKWTLEANKFYTKQGESGPTGDAFVITPDWIDYNDASKDDAKLPLWSTKNIGATNGNTEESWYGDYYAWGEILPYYADDYAYATPCGNWRDMTTGAGNNEITGYNKATYYLSGSSEWTYPPYEDNVLISERDIASSYGDGWRMPTGGESGDSDWEKLAANTYWKWTENYKGITGLNGYVVYKVKAANDKGKTGTTAPNGENYSTDSDPHMFLPAAGYRTDNILGDEESYGVPGADGYYWSSSLHSGKSCAYDTYFTSPNYFDTQDYSGRYYGMTVRPVRSSQN